MNLDDLPPQLKFVYLAMTKSAIFFKEMERDKKFFLSFSEEIWDSMEITDLEHLKNVLNEKMEMDIKPYVDSYLKGK
mgnify:CR=1 FL=1